MSEKESKRNQSPNIPDFTQEIESLSERFDIVADHAESITEHVESIAEEVERRSRRWYGRLLQNYLEDDPDSLATFIAFNAMFSFMPIIMTMAATITIIIQSFTTVEKTTRDQFAESLPPAISEPVEVIMDQSSEGLLGIGLVTLVLLFWGGTRLYNSLDMAFARIYRTRRRLWVSRKLVGMIMVPILALTIILTTLTTAFIVGLLLLPVDHLIDFVPDLSGYAVAIAVIYILGFAMMILAFTIVPVHRPSVRSALPGAATSALLFMVLSMLFPLYIRFFGGYSLYGTVFGLVLALMLWFYLAGQIIVVGAEINAYREGRR